MKNQLNLWAAIGLLSFALAPVQACKKKSSGSSDTATTSAADNPDGGSAPVSINTLALTGIVASTESSSGSSLALTSGEATMNCQAEGEEATAVSTTINADSGEFTFTAAQVAPFSGKVVSCYIALADGSTNYLKTFSVPADAKAADVTATYDKESGAVDDKVEITKSTGDVVASDDTYAPLPAALMSFNPAGITGEYGVKSCELDRTSTSTGDAIRAVKKGDLAATGLTSTCTGWERQGIYLRGEPGVVGSASPVVQDIPPTLAMWNRKADYDACYGSGSLNMAITDGTNTFSFGDGKGVTASALYDKIAAFGWAPQVALDRATAANPDNAPADPESAQILAVLSAQYPADPCGGFAADLAKDWAKDAVGVAKKGGRAFCDGALRYSTPIAQMNEMLNKEIIDNPEQTDGGMRDNCGEYKVAKTADGKKKAVDRFISMCKSFLAGKPGEHEAQRAKLELVDSFTRSIGELKWQTGDTRFDALKNSMKGLDLDTPSGIALASLETMASEWMLVSWDWRARRILEFAVASMSTAITGADDWLGINGQTGRAVIEGLLSDSQTRNNLDELVCSDQYQMPSLKLMVGTSSLTALEAQLDAPTQQNGMQQTWKSSAPNLAGKKTLLVTFIDAFLANSIGHCERVRLTSQKTQINNYTEGGQNSGWNPVTNFPMMMLGHQLLEAKQRKVMEEIGTLLPTGTYAQLSAKLTELSAFQMGGGSWMTEEMTRMQNKGYDEAGMLYQLKQMLGGEAARSAFRYDSAYLAKMQVIKKSACLPDAQVSWQSSYDADGNEVNYIQVAGPVKQIMKAPLALNGSFVRAVETKLQNGGSCYSGNVNGFTAIPVAAFSTPTEFVSPYMMTWFNGCGGGGGSDSDSLNGMFSLNVVKPVTNQ